MFYSLSDNKLLMRVRISPNSSSCSIKGFFVSAEEEEFLKVSVVSVPEKGKANKELITFFSKKLGVSKSALEIISGEKDKYKKILISGDYDFQKIVVELEKIREEF